MSKYYFCVMNDGFSRCHLKSMPSALKSQNSSTYVIDCVAIWQIGLAQSVKNCSENLGSIQFHARTSATYNNHLN